MRCRVFALPLLTLAFGCGQGAPEGSIVEGIVPVSGIATFKGQPLQDYWVYFGTGKERPATGSVDDQGRFALSTNSEGDGAPVGSHKVWFVYSPVIDAIPGREQTDAPVPPPKVKLPAKYLNPKNTDLTVEVPEAGLSDYKIELK